MKIGVLTFHRCINYGSYWQARCLVEGLRAGGHDAVILDHASRRVDLAEWRCALRPTFPATRMDRPEYRRKVHRFHQAFAALPLSPRFPVDAPSAMPECDAVVVGSDEVWNLSHPWYGGLPVFYGDGVRAGRLLAYAASFGNHDARGGLDPAWSGRLRNFAAIAVRDRLSRDAVAEATGTAPDIVLDPCLQFPLESAGAADPPAGRYVAVYGHGFSPAFAANVAGWARRRRLALVSIGYRNDWADRQWIDAGPHEFARFIAGASAVATNFFHGCVFALRHGRPFACEGSWYRSNKLRCLMAEVGGERHLVGEDTHARDFDTLLDAPPSDAIRQRIARLREASRRYLARALAAGP